MDHVDRHDLVGVEHEELEVVGRLVAVVACGRLHALFLPTTSKHAINKPEGNNNRQAKAKSKANTNDKEQTATHHDSKVLSPSSNAFERDGRAGFPFFHFLVSHVEERVVGVLGHVHALGVIAKEA